MVLIVLRLCCSAVMLHEFDVIMFIGLEMVLILWGSVCCMCACMFEMYAVQPLNLGSLLFFSLWFSSPCLVPCSRSSQAFHDFTLAASQSFFSFFLYYLFVLFVFTCSEVIRIEINLYWYRNSNPRYEYDHSAFEPRWYLREFLAWWSSVWMLQG